MTANRGMRHRLQITAQMAGDDRAALETLAELYMDGLVGAGKRLPYLANGTTDTMPERMELTIRATIWARDEPEARVQFWAITQAISLIIQDGPSGHLIDRLELIEP